MSISLSHPSEAAPHPCPEATSTVNSMNRTHYKALSQELLKSRLPPWRKLHFTNRIQRSENALSAQRAGGPGLRGSGGRGAPPSPTPDGVPVWTSSASAGHREGPASQGTQEPLGKGMLERALQNGVDLDKSRSGVGGGGGREAAQLRTGKRDRWIQLQVERKGKKKKPSACGEEQVAGRAKHRTGAQNQARVPGAPTRAESSPQRQQMDSIMRRLMNPSISRARLTDARP